MRSAFMAYLAISMTAAPLVSQPHAAHAQHSVERGDEALVAGTGGSGLRLRIAPGIGQRTIGLLAEGTRVEVVDGPILQDGLHWHQVRVADADERTGWVASQYLATPDQPPSLEESGGMRVARTLLVKMTAYANGAEGGAVGSTTRSGTQTRWGVVAVDPRVIPLGSRLLIEGFEDTVFVAEDTGGGVRGAWVDVWFPDLQAARRFGLQYRNVAVLEPAPGN